MKIQSLVFVTVTSLLVTLMGMTTEAQEKKTNAKDLPGEAVPQLWCTYPGNAEGPAAGKKVVLISGDEEYRSEEALPMLGKLLSQRHGFDCAVLFAMNGETNEIDPNNQRNIPGMHLIEDADLVIIALRFRALPDDQMKYFDAHVMAGKPVIALRTSTHAFRYTAEDATNYRHYSFNARDKWLGGFGRHVLGETWVNHHGHHGQESTRGVIAKKQSDNVLLTGVNDVWGPTDVYGVRELPEGCDVLLHGEVVAGMSPTDKAVEGEKNDPMMALAWTRQWDTGAGTKCPIFCTTMGAATDFESAGLRRLLVNAAFQMTGLEGQIKEDLNVDIVDEFIPSDFGFNKFKKGMKPSQFDLKK